MIRLLLFVALTGEAVILIAIAVRVDPMAGSAPLLTAFALACAFAGIALLAHQRAPLSLPFILLAALLLRLPLIFTEPTLSDDAWRYLHDGRALLAGVNPYAHAPADAATAPYRGAGHDRINHPQLVTVYPPAAQLFFLVNAVLGASLVTWKFLLLVTEAALIMILAATLRRHRRPPHLVAIYAWHPLAVLEIAGNGHLEPLAIAPLLLALLLARHGRHASAGAALAVSAAVKYWAAPLLPLIVRARPIRASVAAIAVLGLLYLPYAFGPSPLGSIGVFAGSWESNASLFPVLEYLLGSRALALPVAATALAALLVRCWRVRAPAEDAAFIFVFATLLVSPVVHPWYLLWLLALLPLRRRADPVTLAGIWWTVTVPVAYSALPAFADAGIWRVTPLALLAQYAPVAVLLGAGAVTTLATTRRSRAAAPAS